MWAHLGARAAGVGEMLVPAVEQANFADTLAMRARYGCRVALGLHFPSDALAGLCLGVLCAALVQWAGPALARYSAGRGRRPEAELLS